MAGRFLPASGIPDRTSSMAIISMALGTTSDGPTVALKPGGAVRMGSGRENDRGGWRTAPV